MYAVGTLNKQSSLLGLISGITFSIRFIPFNFNYMTVELTNFKELPHHAVSVIFVFKEESSHASNPKFNENYFSLESPVQDMFGQLILKPSSVALG